MMGKTNIFSRYWIAYGGFRALFTSSYFWISIVLTAVLFPHWTKPNWWNDVLSIMPSVLGFSLGGFAMWMAIGDDDFRKLIAGSEMNQPNQNSNEENGKVSSYMQVNSAFVHFILLQMLAIFCAVLAKAYYFPLPKDHWLLGIFGHDFYKLCLVGDFIGYFIFVYSLMSAVAATMAIFRVSSWYDMYRTNELNKSNENEANK
ncbi:hypothetical protein [Shewanella dokdonensis]|uniref:Transmembrane protein n=1 Tax=Shewanella dokdonensis TaxID=712036 RepID=A0ABX8DEW3_9GAMM|nr:hypothetical protein [Shewanella dokdonensis]MCL1076501.1 hypothetical protein [Shewanella dokdonensis]QVK23279.1 hypothetical protein KHX94_00070 [Shewanella dokdonensis]